MTRSQHVAQREAEAISTALKSVFLFRALSDADRYMIAPYLEERTLRAGEVLMVEGEPAEHFYVCVQGKLRVERGRTHLVDIHPGGHVGALALARPVQRSATVRALEDCRLLGLSRKRFQQLLKRRAQMGSTLAVNLLDAVGERMRSLTDELESATSRIDELEHRLEMIRLMTEGKSLHVLSEDEPTMP